jgi:GMP synthase (glutamine-hydrolysing)
MRVLAIVHQRDAGPGVFAEEMRSRGVELDLWPIAEGAEAPGDPAAYDAVMTFGGAMHPDQEADRPWLREEKALLAGALEAEVPVLGACLGCQLLTEAAGGEARRASRPEIGWHEVEVNSEGAEDALMGPLAPSFPAFQWHSYEAIPPPGATLLATSEVCAQAYRLRERAWGIQFHAEVTGSDLERWIADWREDADAVRIGLDAEALGARTGEMIAGWNRLGRELCGRFLDAVAR